MTGTAREGIDITRVFDAPREQVFAAWTTPEHLRPGPGRAPRTPTVSMDQVREGTARSGCAYASRSTGYRARRSVPAAVSREDAGAPADWSSAEGSPASPPTRRASSAPSCDQREKVRQPAQQAGNLTPEQYAAAEDGWEAFFDALVNRLAAV